MDFQQKRLKDLNALYIDHESHINSVQAGLKRELPLLVQEFQLSLDQTAALDDYVNDRDTLKWRIRESVHNLTLSDIDPLFFDEPFAFFHDQPDRYGRPILLVQLSHLPATLNDQSDKITFLFPFVTFVLETARKITWEATQERLKQGVPNPILTDILVLVDFKNARSLPRDAKLMQAFIQLLRRYPLSAGTVCLLNFGWMYQGLWQMVKLLLTEEAKNRVCFPKVKELAEWIDETELLTVLASKNSVSWDLNQDQIYNRKQAQTASSLSSPNVLSRRNSTCTVYYDSYDITQISRTPSFTHLHPFTYQQQRRLSTTASTCYATPVGGMTPISSHGNLTALTKPPRIRSAFKNFLDPNDGVSSWLLSEKLTALQEQQSEEETTWSSEDEAEPSRRRLRRTNRQRKRDVAVGLVFGMMFSAQRLMRVMIIRMLKKAVRYRNTVYWIAACILLRDGLQEFMQQILSLMGEVLADRLSLGIQDASAAGIRSIFSLTTGHRGQLTL
ncbi:hypothetical protein INT45_001503 [Circinella minor]|uniref:CRAL-TRIO domain-containing protein n=1 Tax=Circinella minor TaxID=1195481 RepID=A0A8H7VSC6_9FUNG|nr:hypothetical protein INT45_001503 [Circinella minor]